MNLFLNFSIFLMKVLRIKFISSNIVGQSESSSAQIGSKIQLDTWFETLLCEDNYDKIYETLQNSTIEEYNECSNK